MRPIRIDSDLNDLLDAAKALGVIAAWNDAGLFDLVKDAPKALSELPGDPRAVAITAPVLAHLGLLVGDGERVEASTVARRLLESGEMPTARNFDFLRSAAKMGDLLREGGPVKDDEGRPQGTTGGVRPDDPEGSRAFLDRLYRWSEDSARQTFEWVSPRIQPGSRVLDLGGGHGRYGRVFVDAGHSATLFDLPMVVDFARERHGEAMSYASGDFLAGADLGGPYDVVLLSNIVHGQSPDENRELVARLHAAMAPGGLLVLKDMFIDDQGRDPSNAVFFGLTMLFYTERGRSYDLDEVREWCAAAGFEPPEIAVMERFSLVMARRP